MEGANCAGLPPFVIDKYFGCNIRTEPLQAMAALAICGNCAVREQCRDEALSQPHLPGGGILGGVTVSEIARARSWRTYELGLTERVPRGPRPIWLDRPEAAETIEQLRVETDPEESDFIQR